MFFVFLHLPLICKACNLAKCSSENRADVGAAVVDNADGAAVVFKDVHGVGEKEVGDGALPCPSSLSLSSTLPPSPSSWLKVGRMPAVHPTNLIKRVVTAGGGGGRGRLPGKPGELQLWHWSVPLPLALGVDGGDDGDDLQLQDGLV